MNKVISKMVKPKEDMNKLISIMVKIQKFGKP